ncbi:MAG: hypothetical protein CMF59_04565 [Leptospiraceae bacterium]|nr:hypothetical protein [Leptospiraceae bacterium]
MYEQNFKLIRDLIDRREPVYGILSFIEDTIGAIRADLGPESNVESYRHLEEIASALESISRELV